MEYRSITPADYGPVRQFLAGLGWEVRVEDPERFRLMMERADRKVVALDAGQVIGFGRALCDGVSNGYISMLAVAPDWRRQGIGREIVRRLMAGDEDGQLTWVLRAGRDSGAFWRRLGFQPSQLAMERTRRAG